MRALALALGVVLLGLAGVLLHWRQVFFATNLHPVIAGEVWRSAQPDPEHLATWRRELGLASVLCLRGADEDEAWWRRERAAAAELGLDLRAVELDERRMAAPEVLLEVVGHLAEASRPLLLHCQAGVDRSGLGAALALLLDGADPAVARGQYAAGYGYSDWLSGTCHPQVLDQYERWLDERGLDHAPARLVAFLERDYVADFYAADLSVVAWPEPLTAGRGGELVFEVRNASPMTIPFRATPEAGVHARVYLLARDLEPRWTRKLRAAEVDLDLEPGAAARFTAVLPEFPAPGPYVARLALVDEHVAFFRDRGDRDLVVPFEVAAGE